MAEPKGTTEKISITLSRKVKEITDKVLTPVGFFEPPKGSYSSLIGTAIQDYLERVHGAQILDIFDFYNNNPEATFDDARNYFISNPSNNPTLAEILSDGGAAVGD